MPLCGSIASKMRSKKEQMDAELTEMLIQRQELSSMSIPLSLQLTKLHCVRDLSTSVKSMIILAPLWIKSAHSMLSQEVLKDGSTCLVMKTDRDLSYRSLMLIKSLRKSVLMLEMLSSK